MGNSATPAVAHISIILGRFANGEGLIGGARWIRTAGPARFGRKRRLPASFGPLSAPLGAAEADRRTTGF
jgi:hypothetical protein